MKQIVQAILRLFLAIIRHLLYFLALIFASLRYLSKQSMINAFWFSFGKWIFVITNIFHLWDRGFDPHFRLMTLVWKELVNGLPKVVGFLRFPPTEWPYWYLRNTTLIYTNVLSRVSVSRLRPPKCFAFSTRPGVSLHVATRKPNYLTVEIALIKHTKSLLGKFVLWNISLNICIDLRCLRNRSGLSAKSIVIM